MQIRNATYHDAPAIKLLLEVLGYPARISLLINQLETLFGKDDHQVFVCEVKKEVIGFVSIHYLPQLGFTNGMALISYLSVDEIEKNQGIAKSLEQFAAEQAKSHHCDRVQVHCLDWRTPIHRFYEQQGYQEYPKFFIKKLV
jgi:GNAT superfamily N-acetyltransferase